MKKLLFLFAIIASIVICLPMNAKEIKVSQARKAVEKDAQLVYTAKTTGKPDFYVFNTQKGYRIVAADDVVGDGVVLAYSDNGMFDYSRMPESLRDLLTQYQEEIEWLRKNGKKASSLPTNMGKVVVPPLLGDNLWEQCYPYNEMCPPFNDGHCYTGCMATAMSMVMWYWKWPLQGAGNHSYTWQEQTFSSDFSQHTYRWDLMRPYYKIKDEEFTDEEVNAIAQLSYDCGVSIDMMYNHDGEGSSGSYNGNVPVALNNYFGYEKGTHSSREKAKNWDTQLKKELDAKRPIVYGGRGVMGGHALVCDGYTSEGYFHFNLGMGGFYNGFYLTTICGMLFYSFTHNQSACFGVRPSGESYRHVVDGITYVMLSPSSVQVFFPEDTFYVGDIVIPSEVSIDGKDYAVTSISPAAFTNSAVTSVTIPSSVTDLENYTFWNCPELRDVYVMWDTPLQCESKVFDVDAISNVTIHLPEGRAEDYRNVCPWSMMNIDDSQETSEWTPWEREETGYCSFVTNGTSIPSQENLPLYVRTSKSDASKCQYRIDYWGYESAIIIDVDMATGKCQVPIFSQGDKGSIYTLLSDLPHYDPQYSYDDYPCTFDKEKGIFTLTLSLSTNGKPAQIFTYYVYIGEIIPDWTLMYRGTYNYSVWEKVIQNDVLAYQDKVHNWRWKFSNMYDGSEFLFYLLPIANFIYFNQQTTGFVYKKKEVTAWDLHNTEYPSEYSYYDPDEMTFHFGIGYQGAGFTEKGWETYVVTEVTGVESPKAESQGLRAESGEYNLAGQRVGKDYKGIVIKNGRKILRK